MFVLYGHQIFFKPGPADGLSGIVFDNAGAAPDEAVWRRALSCHHGEQNSFRSHGHLFFDLYRLFLSFLCKQFFIFFQFGGRNFNDRLFMDTFECIFSDGF